MRALVWKLSVTMPICAPVKLIAGTPRAWIAIAMSATLTCSPVDRSMSISRAGGLSVISLASVDQLVGRVAPRAETTTSTCEPLLMGANGPAGGGQDLVGRGDARAAEFLDEEGHRHVAPGRNRRVGPCRSGQADGGQRRPDA